MEGQVVIDREAAKSEATRKVRELAACIVWTRPRSIVVAFDAEGTLLSVDEVKVLGGHHWFTDQDDAVRELQLRRAKMVFLIHNHASGKPSPSPRDRKDSETFAEKLNAVGITLSMHLIVDNKGTELCAVTGA